MTRQEFTAGPAFILDGGWPGDFTDNDENAYYFLLNDFTVEQVTNALKAMRHQKFRPSASEIANALSPQQAAIPTFEEVFALLLGPRGALRKPTPFAVEQITEMHPLIGSFVERQGIEHLKVLPVHDPDNGHWRRTELQTAWTVHVDVMEGRELVALAAGSGREDLRQLDPLVGITAPERPVLTATTEGETP